LVRGASAAANLTEPGRRADGFAPAVARSAAGTSPDYKIEIMVVAAR